MKLYGAPGCGSTVVEGVLQLSRQPYDYVQTSFWGQNEHFEALKKADPQARVPTLVLDDGAVMTESAAMLPYFADKMPGLIPAEAAARAWFIEHCPKLASAVTVTEQHPVVARVWETNFGN